MYYMGEHFVWLNSYVRFTAVAAEQLMHDAMGE